MAEHLRYPVHWQPTSGGANFTLPSWWRVGGARRQPTQVTFNDPETGLRIHWNSRDQRFGVHPRVAYADPARKTAAVAPAARADSPPEAGKKPTAAVTSAVPLRLWAYEPWNITWWVSQLFFWGSWLFAAKAAILLWWDSSNAGVVAASIALASSYGFFLPGAYLLVVEALNTTSTVNFGYAVRHSVSAAGDRIALLLPLHHLTHHDQQPNGVEPRWLPPLHSYHVLEYVRHSLKELASRSVQHSPAFSAPATATPPLLLPASTPSPHVSVQSEPNHATAPALLDDEPSSPDADIAGAPAPGALNGHRTSELPMLERRGPSEPNGSVTVAPVPEDATMAKLAVPGASTATPLSTGSSGRASSAVAADLVPQEYSFVWWGARWGEVGYIGAIITLMGSALFAACNTTSLVDTVVPVPEGYYIAFFWAIELLASVCFVLTGLLYTRESQPSLTEPQFFKLGWQASFWNLLGGIGFFIIGLMGFATYAPNAPVDSIVYGIHMTSFVASTAFAIGSSFRLVETVNRHIGARELDVHTTPTV